MWRLLHLRDIKHNTFPSSTLGLPFPAPSPVDSDGTGKKDSGLMRRTPCTGQDHGLPSRHMWLFFDPLIPTNFLPFVSLWGTGKQHQPLWHFLCCWSSALTLHALLLLDPVVARWDKPATSKVISLFIPVRWRREMIQDYKTDSDYSVFLPCAFHSPNMIPAPSGWGRAPARRPLAGTFWWRHPCSSATLGGMRTCWVLGPLTAACHGMHIPCRSIICPAWDWLPGGASLSPTGEAISTGWVEEACGGITPEEEKRLWTLWDFRTYY